MEQDIHRLIERFMAGLTSIEEERFIADYLRTYEVDGDLLPYKRMFAWFDEGMPMKESAEKEQTDLSVPPHVPRHAKGGSRPALLRKVSYFIMAAAAAALLFAVVWPGLATNGTKADGQQHDRGGATRRESACG